MRLRPSHFKHIKKAESVSTAANSNKLHSFCPFHVLRSSGKHHQEVGGMGHLSSVFQTGFHCAGACTSSKTLVWRGRGRTQAPLPHQHFMMGRQREDSGVHAGAVRGTRIALCALHKVLAPLPSQICSSTPRLVQPPPSMTLKQWTVDTPPVKHLHL